jgi:hypothetical protein
MQELMILESQLQAMQESIKAIYMIETPDGEWTAMIETDFFRARLQTFRGKERYFASASAAMAMVRRSLPKHRDIIFRLAAKDTAQEDKPTDP